MQLHWRERGESERERRESECRRRQAKQNQYQIFKHFKLLVCTYENNYAKLKKAKSKQDEDEGKGEGEGKVQGK